MNARNLEIWFITGSQHLYGENALRQVAENSQTIVQGLNDSAHLPLKIVFKSVVTTPQAILNVCREANSHPECAGVVTWMHTFSPAKMWIAGLKTLDKPLAHFHTQLFRDLPWSTIDMNFMNLHQAAHGDREFGFICSRMKKPRKVIVGHWQDPEVHERLNAWMRAAAGLHEFHQLKVARFGDNMRQVAVTEGDKVKAQISLGLEVHGFGISELVSSMQDVSEDEIDRILGEYESEYEMAPSLRTEGDKRSSLRYAARVESGLKAFLEQGGFYAFTDTFEDLSGLEQLPGLAVQRLMAQGYGFGAEGDWKTAALDRVMKVMSAGLPGGTSFMEDYTYHLDPSSPLVLGAHMLEVCPSLAAEKPYCDVQPLGIGGKDDPVRLIFTASAGPALNAAMIDLGDRFRLLINEIDVVAPPQPLPKLPVASVIWSPRPDFKTAAAAWIYSGGPHHTVLTKALSREVLEDFAEMVSMECVVIGADTKLAEIKKELRWNNAAYCCR